MTKDWPQSSKIANDVQVGIVMEDDYPSKNINGHLAILDMEVRTDEETGHISHRHYEKPIFVPPTPNGELAKILKRVADRSTEAGVKFKIVESGGKKLEAALKTANPTESPGCIDRRCVACRNERGSGGNCRGSNINYKMECQLCPTNQIYRGVIKESFYNRPGT